MDKFIIFVINILNLKCQIFFDKKKIDGTPRKVLDVSIAKKLGWKSKTSLKDGLLKTYNYYLKQKNLSDWNYYNNCSKK